MFEVCERGARACGKRRRRALCPARWEIGAGAAFNARPLGAATRIPNIVYNYSSAEPPAVIPVTPQALSAEGVDCGKAGKSGLGGSTIMSAQTPRSRLEAA
jgi:hypothetical protein